MLHKFYMCLFFLQIIMNVLFAQKFQLGFQIESNGIKASHGNEAVPYTGSILGLQFHATVFLFSERFALEARAAVMGGVNFYSGNETGLMAKYFVLKSAYVIGGIIWHKIDSDGRFGYYVYGSNLRMPAFGIGVNPVNPLNFEVLYLYTGAPEVGQYWEKLNEPRVPVNLKYALKIGIGVNFNIFHWEM